MSCNAGLIFAGVPTYDKFQSLSGFPMVATLCLDKLVCAMRQFQTPTRLELNVSVLTLLNPIGFPMSCNDKGSGGLACFLILSGFPMSCKCRRVF